MHPSPAPTRAAPGSRCGFWLLLLSGLCVPWSLLWDFSWESTVGIDRFSSPPHVLTHVAMTFAIVGVVALAAFPGRSIGANREMIRLGRAHAPMGAWLAAWGVLAFATAVLFDQWWQSAYGLEAGIWHPPQILKATAFFAVLFGLWLIGAVAQNASERKISAAVLFCFGGGLLLALVNIVTVTASYPNRQHSASFFQIACASYPVVLTALAAAGRLRWAATAGAMVYTLVVGAMVWLLPLVPAKPLTGPIYNPMQHLMPPPFPLLLIVPALGTDLLMKKFRWPAWRLAGWLQSLLLGFAFVLLFLYAQWTFAGFLLTPAADNWFFAGGGKHWPFFLKINPPARVAFWDAPPDVMNGRNTLMTLGLSVAAARLGLWLGAWLKRVRR